MLGGHGAHTAHHGAFKRAGLFGGDAGFEHGHVAALLNVPHGNARGQQRLFKGEAAPDQKAHIALLPVGGGIGQLFGEHAVLIHPVAGNVGDKAGPLAHGVGDGAALHDFQHRAGEGIQAGVLLKIGGVLRRQNDQVGLSVTGAHTCRGEVDLTPADGSPHLGGGLVDVRGNVKSHGWLLSGCSKAEKTAGGFKQREKPGGFSTTEGSDCGKRAAYPFTTSASRASAPRWKCRACWAA